MSIRIHLAAGAVATAALIAGCGGSDSGTVGQTTQRTAPPASASGTKVAVRQTGVGRTLVDGAGRTLYLFEKDSGTRSACYGACAQVWPPFTTSSRPAAGSGADAAKIGTAKRRDGATQVTYAGRPLYFYATDRQPGDVRGQQVDQFGAEWYALTPAGGKLEGKGGGASGGGGGGASGGGGGSSGGGGGASGGGGGGYSY